MSTTPVTASNLRMRKTFAQMQNLIDIPNLIALQKKSYEAFLQRDVDPDRRAEEWFAMVFLNRFSQFLILTTPPA